MSLLGSWTPVASSALGASAPRRVRSPRRSVGSAPMTSAPLATSFRRHVRGARSAPPSAIDDETTSSSTTTSTADPFVAIFAEDGPLKDLAELPAQLARTVARVLEPPPPNFPPGPRGDAAIELGADPLAYIVRAQREHGDVVGLSLAGERCVLVGDPDVAADVLVHRAPLFVKEGTAFFPGSSLAGEGLLVSDGDVWARQRRLTNPAFRRAAVDTYASSMANAGVSLLSNEWKTRSVRDVYEDFNTLTLRVVADALFGADVRGARAMEINAAIKEAFEFFGNRSSTGFIVPEWVPIPDNVRYNAAVARLDAAVYGLIAERRAKRGESSRDTSSDDRSTTPVDVNRRVPRVNWDPERKDWVDAEARTEEGRSTASSSGAASAASPDLLDRLLDARDDGEDGDGAGMDDTSLRDELMTLMVAGQETSAILLSWCCALLAQHPDVAERVAAEATSTLGPDPLVNLPSAADVARMPYVEATVLETMRLLPPAYMVGRCCAEDVVVGGYDLPEGTTILVSPYLLHRDARNWDDPDAFRPERWLEPGGTPGGSREATDAVTDNANAEKDPSEAMAKGALKGMGPGGVYVPFGAGPRVCIGTGFAMMEAVLLLATVARGVEFRLRPGAPPPRPRALITLRPELVELDVVPKKTR